MRERNNLLNIQSNYNICDFQNLGKEIEIGSPYITQMMEGGHKRWSPIKSHKDATRRFGYLQWNNELDKNCSGITGE